MTLDLAAFLVVAAVILGSALRVVTARNLVHTVLWLAVSLGSTAVAFVLLEAQFLAAMQIILYTGGVLTLMLFGVMLTQRDQGFVTVQNPSHRLFAGGLLASAVFLFLAAAVTQTPLARAPVPQPDAKALGAAFLTTHVLAFEVLSVLLLAAVLGAIVLARRRDAGDARDQRPAVPARRPLPLPVKRVATQEGAQG